MENQRVRLSKMMLKNALLRLLKIKAIEKISIYELCDEAQINRTTFYKYYGSQYDLLTEIENDLFSELEQNIIDSCSNGEDSLVMVLKLLLSKKETLITLINTVSDEDFTEKLFSLPIIHTLLTAEIPHDFDERQSEYVYLFFCQGCYAIIRRWLNNENRELPEMLSKLIYDLVHRILK